eukprot:14045965-Alexandrium_andersonii.AAC.1
MPVFGGGVGVCAENASERTSRELRGPMLRLFLGPRSSSFERLEHLGMFGRADRGCGGLQH